MRAHENLVTFQGGAASVNDTDYDNGGGGLINVGEVILMFLLCVKNFLHGISEIDKTTFQRSRPILSFIIIIGYELLLLITDVDCGVRNREGGGGRQERREKTKKRRN